MVTTEQTTNDNHVNLEQVCSLNIEQNRLLQKIAKMGVLDICCRCVLAELGPGQLGPGAKLSPFCGGGGQLSSGQTIGPWAQLPGARLSGARFSRSPFDYHMSLANWALDSWAQTNGPRGPTVLGPIYLVTEDAQIFSHINCTLSLTFKIL